MGQVYRSEGAVASPGHPAETKITILTSANGKRATKCFTTAGVENYAKEHSWRWREAGISTFDDLARLLADVGRDPLSLIVQGVVAPAWREKEIIPRTKRKGEPSLIDEGSRVVHFDIDDLPLPLGTGWHDPEGVARAIWQTVIVANTPAFADVSFVWQASSSAGTPGKEHLAKLHLWAMLDQPIDEDHRKALLKLTGADDSLASINQPNYVAAPIFDRVPDPLADVGRSGVVMGALDHARVDQIAWPEAKIKEAKERKPKGEAGPTITPEGLDHETSEAGRAMLEGICGKIRAASQGGRNKLINRLAYLIGGHVAGGSIAYAEARDALLKAGLTSGHDRYVEAVENGLRDGLQRPIEPQEEAGEDVGDQGIEPYHPAPEGNREKAIPAHGETVRAFFAEALPLIRATKQVQAEAEGLDPDAPDYRQRYRQIRKAARDAFGLDVLPAKTIGKAQKAPRVMLTGAQGVGKTTALVGDPKKQITGALHDATGIVSLSLFPGHAKAAEAYQDYTKAQNGKGPVPLHLKGRSAQDPARPDRAMCLIPSAAEALAKRGVNVRGTLCEKCPLADQCGYIKQEGELKRLAASPEGVAVFAPHDYAFLPLPGGVKPDLIAFDEAPRGLGADDVKISLDALGEGLTYEGRARVKGQIKDAETRADALSDELRLIRPAMIALRNAWQADMTGAGVYAELIAEGWTAERFREAQDALSQFEAATITQDIDAAAWATQGDGDAFGRKVEKAAEAQQARITQALGRLFKTVAHEIEAGQAAPVAIVFETGRGGQASALRIAYVRSPTFSDHAPFLHLDGTGDHDLAGAVFGSMRLERHKVERLANVTQVTGKTFSNLSITGQNKRGDLFGGNVSWQAPALRRDLIAFAHSKPGALVVANKGVIQALKAEGLQNATAHFGGLRGRNEWEDLSEIILIGREQPPPSAVELIARAFASKAGVPFQPIGGRYPEIQRALRMRNGQPVPIKTPHHPDPWADRVLAQMRDAEALQAIDRIRPMFKPVAVYALAELCLDLTVDAVTSWTDLKAGGDLITRTIAQAGVLPLSPREAERLFPDIWTRSSASRELEPLKNKVDAALQASAEQVSQDANSISYLQSGTLIGATLIEYRTAPKDGRRTGNKMTALVWGPLSEARAKVEAVAGPLAAFAVVPEWEAVADAIDAAEERAAIQAEANGLSAQYAREVANMAQGKRADRARDANLRVLPLSPQAKRQDRPPDAPKIMSFRQGKGQRARP